MSREPGSRDTILVHQSDRLFVGADPFVGVRHCGHNIPQLLRRHAPLEFNWPGGGWNVMDVSAQNDRFSIPQLFERWPTPILTGFEHKVQFGLTMARLVRAIDG